MYEFISDFIGLLMTTATGLAPGALGAAVGLAHEKGLKWSERFIQFAAGTTVSYFAQHVVGALFAFDPYVLQGIGFSAGMVAFKATPRFIASAAEVAAGLPGAIRDRIFPTKKDKP